MFCYSLICFPSKTINKLSEISIRESEIEDIIKSLITNKASGPDLISHRMLKGVSKTTHMVLAQDTSSSSGTIGKAKKYGVPVVSFDEFLKM